MDQQRMEAAARELIRRDEFNHLFDPNNVDEKRGQGNGNRDRQNRQDDRNERSLRYSIRDIPNFDGKEDAMPHTHLIEFEDFLVNTGSEINELPQHGEPQAVDRPHYEAVIRDVVSKFKASLKGKPRLWFEMQYPNVDDEPKTVQAYGNMLSTFTTEHNTTGSTREQQIMAWKTLKWEPTKEKLDDFVYKFRRMAKELGYNADENLDVFTCVPCHLYLYLKGITTIKGAIEKYQKSMCLRWSFSTSYPSPSRNMNDRQTLQTVSFKEEETQDKVNDGLEKLSQILEKQIQLAEEQINDSKSRGRRRERSDSRDRRSYNRSNSYDRSSSYDRSKSRDRSRERSSRNKSRNQNSSEKRNNSGTRYSSGLFCDHCKMTNHEILNYYKLQKTLKKKGVSLNEATRKNMSEQEKYQMFMEFKTYMDAKDPTN